MSRFAVTLLALAALGPAQRAQTFTGVITDSMCANGNHSVMRMGPTDAECTRACVEAHGASYVLYDGKSAYELSDQKSAEKFAGQGVRVTGTLDEKAHKIQVDSITAAK
jgi:hypothetical protein